MAPSTQLKWQKEPYIALEMLPTQKEANQRECDENVVRVK